MQGVVEDDENEERHDLRIGPGNIADFLMADFSARQERANNSGSITAARVNLFLVVVTAGSVAVGWAWRSGSPNSAHAAFPAALVAAGVLVPILLTVVC